MTKPKGNYSYLDRTIFVCTGEPCPVSDKPRWHVKAFRRNGEEYPESALFQFKTTRAAEEAIRVENRYRERQPAPEATSLG